jgi:hypothetical protein
MCQALGGSGQVGPSKNGRWRLFKMAVDDDVSPVPHVVF